ncbi:MAG TPA: TolC family protein [Chryseolinea sp.]
MKKLLSIIFLAEILFSANAQETVLTLNDAIKQALERSPSIQAATLETERQKALKQTAFEIPKTDVSLMYGQYNSIQKADNNLTIVQSIPFPTTFGTQKELNKAQVESALMRERVSKNELAFQVKLVFNQLLYLKLRRGSLLQQDSLLGDLLRIANVQYKTGEGTLLARTTAETQWSEIQNINARNEADIRIALNHLQLLCQSSPITDVQGSLDDFIPASEIDSLAFQDNPSLAYTHQQVEIAHWQRKVETARALPDLRVGYFNQTLIGMQNVNGQDQYFSASKRFQGFQVGIQIPLWFAPHTARIKAATFAKEVAQKQNEAFALTLAQQYGQAVQEAIKNRNSLAYYTGSALGTAALLINQSRVAFKNGEVDHTALLLNLRQALTIREGYMTAMLQYNQSRIIIDYLNGKM